LQSVFKFWVDSENARPISDYSDEKTATSLDFMIRIQPVDAEASHTEH